MNKRRILSDVQIIEAAEMRERGHSVEWIARRFKCSRGVIGWHMLRVGADPLKLAVRELPQTRPGPIEYVRNGRVVRFFTPADDDLIQRLSKEGLKVTVIARSLNPPRSANSVLARLMTLARHEARREAAKERS